MMRMGRRQLLKASTAIAGAGMLRPVLSLIGAGDSIESAYPDEILSIDSYTKGRVKPGMIIGKDNADLVKDIAPEGLYVELTRGAEIKIAETTPRADALIYVPWLEATLRNKGQAVLDKSGQLWTRDQQPWIGGDPFPAPQSPVEAVWNHTFNYFRLDDSYTITREVIVNSEGSVVRRGETESIDIHPVGRVFVGPTPYIDQFKDDLLRTSVTLWAPFDVFGFSVVNTIFYDGTKLPASDGYIPTLKRARRLPTTQRFEPGAPYAVWFVSEFYIQGDPVLTWDWQTVERKPMLGPSPANIAGRAVNATKEDFVWPYSDEKVPRSTWELRPEIVVIDGVCKIDGSPYGKKRIYYDAVYNRAQVADAYDKAGKLWRFITFFFGQTGTQDAKGNPIACRTGIQFVDLQTDVHDNLFDFQSIGSKTFSANTGLHIDDYLTPGALQRRAAK